MSDLIVYLPGHGYTDDDPLYISWLDAIYYVSDKDTDSFKLATEAAGSSLIQFSETVTDGFVREIDDSAGTTTISGLDHLEGEVVKVTSGGNVVATETVSGGSVTVSTSVFTYQTGLPYRMKVRSMRLSVPQDGNTLQTRITRIHETVVRFIRSKLGKAGQEYSGVEYLTDLDTFFNVNAFDKTNPTKGGLSDESYTVVVSDEPLPFTCLATIISFEVEERR